MSREIARIAEDFVELLPHNSTEFDF